MDRLASRAVRSSPIRSPARAEAEHLARIAKALSHPARIEIVRMLHDRQACIGCDIVDGIGLAQSTISEHLRILKEAGVIVGEIDPPRMCYSLNPAAVESLLRFLGALKKAPVTKIKAR